MVDPILLGLVESVLGKEILGQKVIMLFTVPKCNHPKPKLEVNLVPTTKNKNNWACWTCTSFKGTTLNSLFHTLKVDSSKYEELNKILGTTYKVDKVKVRY